jgi:membrane protein
MTPILSFCFGLASWIFTWLFFMAAYMLIPYTKVKWSNALLAGIVAGSAFRILQWLFVSGQLYVTHYNAIYGSFAFLPLMLIWLQLTWMICLLGALICYSAQSIYKFSFATMVEDISVDYTQRVSLAIATVITRRFILGKTPISAQDFITDYGMPPRLVAETTNRLVETRLYARVIIEGDNSRLGFQPACDPDTLTVGRVLMELNNLGNNNFIPDFDENFKATDLHFSNILNAQTSSKDVKLRELDVMLTD